jgi:SNF2 family DNA or RNA helicase
MASVLWKSDTYCLLKVPLTGDNLQLFNQFPAYWAFEGRDVRFKPVGANIRFILEHWPDAEWTGGTERFLEEWQAALGSQVEIKARKRDEGILHQTDNYQYGTHPYDHQRRAFLISRPEEYFGLFMDPGTGKTKVTIDTGAWLYEQGLIDCILVLAPNGVHWNWVDEEIPRHLPERIKCNQYADSGTRSQRQRRQFDRTLSYKGLAIFSFHIEGLSGQVACNMVDEVLAKRRCLWVIDESTRIKTPSAKRTEWITKRYRQAPYRRILTGTPITQGVEDLYAQFLFLNPMILGFKTYTSFKRRYCQERSFGDNSFTKIVGYLNLEELTDKVDGCTFRVRKADCLDLPPKVYQRRQFELSPKARKLYDQLAEEFVAELNGAVVAENLAIVRMMRLQQIASGWWPDDNEDGKLIPIESTFPRLQELQRVLDDVGNDHKYIIWARFRADLELLQSHLGTSAVSYHGGVPEAQRQRNLEAFRKDPTKRYFVANPQNAGIGLTINESDVQIWYCNQFNLELRLQGEDRNHRIGQKANSVLLIDLEARRSQDQKIITALRNKKRIADIVTRDPKGWFLEYEGE